MDAVHLKIAIELVQQARSDTTTTMARVHHHGAQHWRGRLDTVANTSQHLAVVHRNEEKVFVAGTPPSAVLLVERIDKRSGRGAIEDLDFKHCENDNSVGFLDHTTPAFGQPSSAEESFAHKVGLVAIAPPGQEGWPKAGVVVQEIL